MTIAQLKQLRESEDRVEFKEARRNFPFNGGSHREQKDRRKCFLGYVVALANEGGGLLVLGMTDGHPHEVVGTDFASGSVGDLENQVYVHLNIRVHIRENYDEQGKRVVITRIPPRPVGRTMKFEGVALMRTGDGLRNMSDEEVHSILSEQEPDFSAKICEGIGLDDLDPAAIQRMKETYAIKQRNPGFVQLSTGQVLNDLRLLVDGKLNHAALILLGTPEAIREKLPQARIVWEFRATDTQIHHDNREQVDAPLMLGIDMIWRLINQPSLNRKTPVQHGGHIFDIYGFNEEVLREAILNAIAHRDYTITSEVVIKQYPSRIIISNPGGFPKGVTIENILTVSSTPRSRLMTEVMEKTGLVERSGQGVDKIFSITLSEGKAEPDYSRSDPFQVTLELHTEVVDKALHIFISRYRNSGQEPKLGVEQIITLCKVRKGLFRQLRPAVVEQLERAGLIVKLPGHTTRYTLHDDYHRLADEELRIGGRYMVSEVEQVVLALQEGAVKIGHLEQVMTGTLTRNQIRFLLIKLMEDSILVSQGRLKGTRYGLDAKYAALRGDMLVRKVTEDLQAQQS